MTLKEFKESTKNCRDDDEITIRKNDYGQLCCHTTVPVEHVSKGFDWTHGQIVLTPSVNLVTAPEVVQKYRDEELESYSKKCSSYLRIAAKLALMIDNMPDGEDKDKLEKVVREFASL